MKPDVYTVHVRHPAFLLGMLLMLLRYSSLRTHLLLRFFIRFGDMQKQRKVLLCRGRPRTPAVSEMELFVTIVTEWLINSYYYKELHLMCCSGPRCPLLIPEKGFQMVQSLCTQNYSIALHISGLMEFLCTAIPFLSALPVL